VGRRGNPVLLCVTVFSKGHLGSCANAQALRERRVIVTILSEGHLSSYR
jgi:hypothetical protein